MEIQSLELEKFASLSKILREVKVGDELVIPEVLRNPYKVRAELSRFKRMYGIEFTATTIGIENGIKVTRVK